MDRKNLSNTYTQQWNLSVQRELPGGWLVEAGYAGNKGTRLPISLQFNQLDPRYQALGADLNRQVNNPFFGLVPTGQLSTATVAQSVLLRPYPQYTSVSHVESGDRAEHRLFDLPLAYLEGRTTIYPRSERAGGLYKWQADR